MDILASLSAETRAAIVGAVLGAGVAGVVAWLLQLAHNRQSRSLLAQELSHQERLSLYQIEWPWYREVLANAAAFHRSVMASMAGSGTAKSNADGQEALGVLHAAFNIFGRTNVVAAYALRDIISAGKHGIRPGARTGEEAEQISSTLMKAELRLSRILVKSAGMEPAPTAEEVSEMQNLSRDQGQDNAAAER